MEWIDDVIYVLSKHTDPKVVPNADQRRRYAEAQRILEEIKAYDLGNGAAPPVEDAPTEVVEVRINPLKDRPWWRNLW